MRNVLHTILHAWVANRHWMVWNLVLAFIPALLAVRLFRDGRRPTPGWWAGVAVFALFLPNAPYVVSDLIHLPGNVAAAPTRSSVLFGFLPSYAIFITAGVLAYAFCLRRLRTWLGARSLDPGWVAMEMAIHLVSAVGVLIGRVARLNSWDAVVRPKATVWTSLATLSRPSALLAVVTFAALLFVGCRLLSLCLLVTVLSCVAPRGRDATHDRTVVGTGSARVSGGHRYRPGMLLPRSCPVCRRVGDAPCRSCRSTLRRAPHLAVPGGVDQCVALVAFEGAAAVAIRRLKYANHRDALDPFARALARLVEREAGTRAFDHLTWVPAAPSHRRERGYDQGRLIASVVGDELGLAPSRLLVRSDPGAQTGRSLADRLGGPELRARSGAAVGGSVLVVDDVRTSGSSLARAASALRAAGALHVVAATLAATPDRSAA